MISLSSEPGKELSSWSSACAVLILCSACKLILLFGALWFILRGDLLYVLPCVILFLCFQSF